MPTYTNWYVVVVLEVGGEEKTVRGPTRTTETEAQADLDAVRGKVASGAWIDLDWISANPDRFVAVYVDSTSVGFG